MKTIVTGAGGFIGRSLIGYLLGSGDDVYAVTRRDKSKLNITGLDARFVITTDLSSTAGDVEKLIDTDTFVVHAAGHTHLYANSSIADYISGNLDTTRNLLAAIANKGALGLLYLSTVSVYGDVDTPILSERTPFGNPNVYGLTKRLAELLIAEARLECPNICVRLPGVVGQGNFSPWLGCVAQSAIQGEDITIYNGSAVFNNIVDIPELARLVHHIGTELPGAGFDVVNIAASKPVEIRKVVDELLSSLGAKSRIIEKAAERSSYQIDTHRLNRHLNFKSRSTIEMVSQFGSAIFNSANL